MRKTALLADGDVAGRGQRSLRVALLEEDDIVHRAGGAAFQEMAGLGLVGDNTMALAMSSGFRRVSESTCKSLLKSSS